MASNRTRRPRPSEYVDLVPLIGSATRLIGDLVAASPRNLLAFSGGKDSIVMAHLAVRYFRLRKAVCEVSFAFERDVVDYMRVGKALGLSCTYTDGLSMDWLRQNQHLMFADLKAQGELYAKRQQATVRRHATKHGYTGVVFGRRREENTVPRPLYQTKDGRWHCHPIHDWSTANVWQYIEQHRLPYPGIYDSPIGKLEGADPWVGVSMSNAAKHGLNGYDLIWDYDPAPLLEIAAWHEPTRRYVEGRRS
jgi:hypothetical protein